MPAATTKHNVDRASEILNVMTDCFFKKESARQTLPNNQTVKENVEQAASLLRVLLRSAATGWQPVVLSLILTDQLRS